MMLVEGKVPSPGGTTASGGAGSIGSVTNTQRIKIQHDGNYCNMVV